MPRQKTNKSAKGCSCKKSGCLKNYCECFEYKIPCSTYCRCLGCKNTQFIHQPRTSQVSTHVASRESKKEISPLQHETIEASTAGLLSKAAQCDKHQMTQAAMEFELIMQLNRILGVILEDN